MDCFGVWQNYRRQKMIKSLFDNASDINLYSYLGKYGITDVESFLFPKDYFEPSELYDNIEDGCELIYKLAKNKDLIHVAIIQDSDVDGICSAVLAYKFLKNLGVEHIDVKFHEKKTHGLKDMIDELLEHKSFYDLVWCPDSSSNDIEECKALRESNIFVIITDHHEVSKENKHAVLINNQTSDNVSNKNLCGTGVTFKLIQHYCKLHNLDMYKDMIDLVALANIADTCSMLSKENRMFNYYGFRRLRNPFLMALCKEFLRDGVLTPTALGFGVIPKLNAVCRTNNQYAKEKVFYAFANDEYGTFDECIELLKEAHKKQGEESNEMFEELTKEKPYEVNNVMLFKCKATPYTGLVANKLLEHYGKPIMIAHDNDGFISGSARSPIEFKSILKDSGLMKICEGHSKAFGIGWDNSNTASLIEYIKNANIDIDEDEDITVTFKTDNVLGIPKTLFELADEYGELWGTDISQPTICVENITIKSDEIKEYKNNTIKFKIGMIDVLKFGTSDRLKKELGVGESKTVNVTVIGKPSYSFFAGRLTKQILADKIIVN